MAHVVDRLQVQHVGERAFVTDLLGERAPLAEHRRRALVVPAEAQRPAHRADQPCPVRAGDVAESGEGALGDLHRLRDPDASRSAGTPSPTTAGRSRRSSRAPGTGRAPRPSCAGSRPSGPRCAAPERAVRAARRGSPGRRAPRAARACSNWTTASSKAAASNARRPGDREVAHEPARIGAGTGQGQVVGQVARVRLDVVGVAALDRVGGPQVQPLPLEGRDVGEQRLADQLVTEGQVPVACTGAMSRACSASSKASIRASGSAPATSLTKSGRTRGRGSPPR